MWCALHKDHKVLCFELAGWGSLTGGAWKDSELRKCASGLVPDWKNCGSSGYSAVPGRVQNERNEKNESCKTRKDSACLEIAA